MTKKPVYCADCRHFAQTEHDAYCSALVTHKKNWYQEFARSAQPHIQNGNNDCTAWQHKRGLIEWINDLLS